MEKEKDEKQYTDDERDALDETLEKREAIKKTLIRLGIVLVVTGLFVLTIALNRGWGITTKETYKNLNDSFTVPSVLLFMLWAIVKVSSEGAFDALGFIGGTVIRTLVPFGRNKIHKETYAEYKERKNAHRKTTETLGWSVSRCMFVSAVVYFAISLIFLALWYGA